MKTEQVETILDACRKIATRELTMAELAELLRDIEPEPDPEYRPPGIHKDGTG